MKIFTWENKENLSHDSCIDSLKKIWTWNRTSLVKKSESTRSYGRGYAPGGGGAYMRGVYTWSNTSVKEEVSLSAGGLYVGAHRWRNTVFVKRLLHLDRKSFSRFFKRNALSFRRCKIISQRKGKRETRHYGTEWKSLLEKIKKIYHMIHVLTH